MTFLELWKLLRYGVLPAAICIAIGILVIYLLARFSGRVKAPEFALFLVTFGTLGGVLGFATGNSRQPAVGTVLSALLTFLAALLTYLFSKENGKHWQPVIPYCILVLMVNSFFGLFVGSTMRAHTEALERRYAEWQFQYEHVYIEIQKAAGLDWVKGNKPAPRQTPTPPAPPYYLNPA
jgi:peptidoglycan/LPS O-acetylase OafA/YrhL